MLVWFNVNVVLFAVVCDGKELKKNYQKEGVYQQSGSLKMLHCGQGK